MTNIKDLAKNQQPSLKWRWCQTSLVNNKNSDFVKNNQLASQPQGDPQQENCQHHTTKRKWLEAESPKIW